MAGAPRALSAAPRASRARAAEGLRRGSMAGGEARLCAGEARADGAEAALLMRKRGQGAGTAAPMRSVSGLRLPEVHRRPRAAATDAARGHRP